jgi:hypothetical protein
MDCTHEGHGRSLRRALVLGIVTTIGFAGLAVRAQADGDPASDVLATETLFLPQDAGLQPGQQVQLTSLLAAAQRSGYRVRAALIASATDLGSITELWRQPQTYAHFLGQELSLVYHGPLLVLMPNGYGLYGVGGASVQPTELDGLPSPKGALGPAAITAIRRLAAASGHPLPLPSTKGPQALGSSDAVPWIVFGLGLVLVGAAWTLSLRIRPLGGRGNRQRLADG